MERHDIDHIISFAGPLPEVAEGREVLGSIIDCQELGVLIESPELALKVGDAQEVFQDSPDPGLQFL